MKAAQPWRSRVLGFGILTIALCCAKFASAQASPQTPVEEVVIRGHVLSPPPKDPFAAGSVVRADRLKSPGLQSSDVLRAQPGLSVWSTGGHGSLSTAAVRGATSAQTPVYLAGIRLNDDVGGTADLSLIPLWMIHRIEIYRSHAPIQADLLGIGGAIFFEPRIPKGTEAAAGAMTGSFGTHSLFAHAATGDKSASALLGVRYDTSQNNYPYRDDRATRFNPSDDTDKLRTNADSRTYDVWALGTTRLGSNGRLNLLFNGIQRSQGMPGAGFATTTQARVSFHRNLMALTSTVPCAIDYPCETEISATAIRSGAHYLDPLGEALLGAPEVHIGATRVEHSALLRMRVHNAVTIVPSVRASMEHLAAESFGKGTARSRRTFTRAALGVKWQAKPRASLVATGSAECHGTQADGRVPWALPGDVEGTPKDHASLCSAFQPSARLGVELGHAPFTVLANLGYYGRVPTLAELYGISGVVRGNAALTAEKGLVLDAGVRMQPFAHTYVEAFAFVRKADNLIAYQRSSTGYVVPYNVGSARIAGTEIVIGINPASFVLFELGVTGLDARNTSPSRMTTHDVLPYHSRLVVYPRVEFRGRLPVSWIHTSKISASYLRQSSRYSDPANLLLIPAQSSLDVEAELTILAGRFILRGRVSDLLDSYRVDLVGYPLPRRAFYTSMEVQF